MFQQIVRCALARRTQFDGLSCRHVCRCFAMNTITKKDLIDRLADKTGQKRVVVKRIIQGFLDDIIDELGRGNRLEFRDFGVFESKVRAARTAQNPKTLERVEVPQKRTVKFKVGRVMKMKLGMDHDGSGNSRPSPTPSST
ncbi:MAG: HU family DNA-binding protein [Planctomycetia bacterium]|nr:MAG: HU family DNA-binding protein [Planctomycetia bacterium]